MLFKNSGSKNSSMITKKKSAGIGFLLFRVHDDPEAPVLAGSSVSYIICQSEGSTLNFSGLFSRSQLMKPGNFTRSPFFSSSTRQRMYSAAITFFGDP